MLSSRDQRGLETKFDGLVLVISLVVVVVLIRVLVLIKTVLAVSKFDNSKDRL